MLFPEVRMRRLRENNILRDLIHETRLTRHDLIMPLFVVEGISRKEEIKSMPGCYRYPVAGLVDKCRELVDSGIHSVILFGIPQTKDPDGSGAWVENGIIQQAVRALKKAVQQLFVITDVCLCEYTSHGHCGVIENGRILNDPTLAVLSRTALSHMSSGADMVAPSDMMDGRIRAIRRMLDENGYQHTPIMAYSAKYASAFYGPFRDAAGSAPQFGDRKTYQMNPANTREAIREIQLDVDEGADIIMVKPALAYLDIIHQAKSQTRLPVAAYNVSGEYSMVKAASAKGWIDEKLLVLEILTAIKRAGADMILTYHAQDAVKFI